MAWAAIAKGIASFFINYDKSTIQRATDWANWRVQQGNANAQNTVNQANADAANLVRAASNDFQAAQAAFSNARRSIGNKDRLEVAGRQADALEVNSARAIDNMVRGKLSVQLQAASTLGALRANAAARGVGGSSVAMLHSVASLGLGSAETTIKDRSNQITFDTLLQRQGLIRTAVNSQDFGQALPNIDYGVNVAPLVQAPEYIEHGSAFKDAFDSVFMENSVYSNIGARQNQTVGGVSTNWQQLGQNSASNYGPSFGFAQGNGNDYGLSTFTGTSQPTYASGNLSGIFTEQARSSGGWFSGNTGGGTTGAGSGNYFGGA